MSRPMHGDPRIDDKCDVFIELVEKIAQDHKFWRNIDFTRALRVQSALKAASAKANQTVDMLRKKKEGGVKGAAISAGLKY